MSEFTKAATDVLAERRRQVESEGWTPEHDDEHDDGEMAAAAACYASAASCAGNEGLTTFADLPIYWPWGAEAYKPKDQRSALVKAGALILAEIERLDRAAMR